MHIDLTVRDATLGDAAELAALMCELDYETTPAEMETRLKSILPNPDYRTLVGIVDERVCGMIGTLSNLSFEHNDPGGRILALVISNNMRRRGIGRALIAAAEKDFVRRGIKRIALNTRLTRKDAHRFYETLGYQKNGWRFVKT
jgi:ribosomal protein S18 acetylase RimI-like enzyme